VTTSPPDIHLERDGERVTLLIDGSQAMEGWERDIMLRAADILCGERGGDFLEVGLGLGYSALRIARNASTRSHTVVEKHAEVIDLFNAAQHELPPNLTIVHDDIFNYVKQIEYQAFDGVFFDPELPRAVVDDVEFMGVFVPRLVKSMKPGGRFIPMFAMQGERADRATCTASPGHVLERYLPFFERAEIERHAYEAYSTTEYVPSRRGDAFILSFLKAPTT
jgi:predicted methyltransferase